LPLFPKTSFCDQIVTISFSKWSTHLFWYKGHIKDKTKLRRHGGIVSGLSYYGAVQSL